MKTTIRARTLLWAAVWSFEICLGASAPALAQRRQANPEISPQSPQDSQGTPLPEGGQPISPETAPAVPAAPAPAAPAGQAAAPEPSGQQVRGVQIGAEQAAPPPPQAPIDPLEKRVMVRVKDAPLATFLETIHAQANVNFIITEGLENKRVTAFLQDVTVREALQILLELRGLTYTRVGRSRTYLISPRSARAPVHISKIYTLNYVQLIPISGQQAGGTGSPMPLSMAGNPGLSAGSVGGSTAAAGTAGRPAFNDYGISVLSIIHSVLTADGRVEVDPRTNSIVITDIPEVFPQVEQIINQLDRKAPQVMIEAQIVEIDSDRAQQLGIEWGGTNGELASFQGGQRDTTFPLNLPNNLANLHFFNPVTTVQSSLGSSAASGASGSSTSGSTAFNGLVTGSTLKTSVLDLSQLTVVLRALVTRSEARFLGKPKVLTLNNKTAVIQITQNQAIAQQSQQTALGAGTVGVTSITAPERQVTGLLLRVTPQVNEAGYITMLVEPNFVNVVQSAISTPSSPVFDPVNRAASTMVRVRNGQTLVLGGLLSSQENKTVRKVPFLGYIPLIGWLFTSVTSQRNNTDLVIFITPTVVGD